MEETKNEDQSGGKEEIWILVDHSAREMALVPVARELEERGHTVELVTISEVISSAAREALAGGAERLLRGLRVATQGRAGDESLVGAIRRRQPDVLVVTEARYARAIGVLENLTGVQSLQVGLISDFFVDPLWFNGQLHGFVASDQVVADEIIDRGVAEDRIRVGGPALRPGFEEGIDRQEARQELGVEEDQTVVLVRADGFSSTILEKLVFQCTLSDRDGRFIFHYDGDGACASTLRRAADQYGLAAAMFGRVSDLERYFAAADAVLASEDDPYLPELIASSTPTLLIGTTAEREGNGLALKDRGLADFLAGVDRLGTRLDHFLKEETQDSLRTALEQWDGAARHSALVEGLDDIARRAAQWRQPIQTAAAEEGEPEEGEPEEKGEEEKVAGPFEPIGGGGATEVGTDGEEDGRRPPEGATLGRAEAKEQLAQLILEERELERRLEEVEKQQERWHGRLELAREWNETDLVDEAKSILRGYVEEADAIDGDLSDIRRQKAKLKAAARPGGGDSTADGEESASDRASRLERRFRKMEVDRDLEGLKDRIRRELGE